MITKITGKLVHLSEEAATLEIGAFEYEVFIPEFVRRQLQPTVGADISLKTIEFIDGKFALCDAARDAAKECVYGRRRSGEARWHPDVLGDQPQWT